MLSGGFFGSMLLPDGTYDLEYTEEDFARYFANFIGNGVFANPANQLKVVAAKDAEGNPSMSVTVRAGNGYCRGYWANLDEDMELRIGNAAGNLSRYDAVVLRFDFDIRAVTIAVKEGAFHASPQRPAIQQDENVFELCLAYVYVGPAVLEITDAAITDTRPDNSLCGFVTGLVKQITTTELFQQYNDEFYRFYRRETAAYENWTAETKDAYDRYVAAKRAEYQEFVDDTTNEYEQFSNQRKEVWVEWFENLKIQLEGDVAANLQRQIDGLAERQKLLDVKYLEDEKTLYFPMGDIVVIDKTLFL